MRSHSYPALSQPGTIRLALAGFVAATLVAFAGVPDAGAAPMLTASPNPVVIPYGSTMTTTNVAYNTGTSGLAELWVSVDGGADVLLVSATATGGVHILPVTYGSTYVIKLYDGRRRTAPPVATTTVTTARPPILILSPGVIFALRTRTVEVSFTRVTVTDDSDDLSAGDLQFWFMANGLGPQTWAGDVSTGASIFPSRTFTIEDAPGTLTLRVTGADDDEFCPFSLCTCGRAMPEGNGSNECADWSTVTRTIDVSGPATTGTFEMVATGSPLKFRVFGTYRVSYSF